MNQNYKAMLDTIAWSEGTDRGARGDRGYNVIVGGGRFTDYGTHPHVLVDLPRLGIKSSAAGRYQFIYPTWRALQRRLGLLDFGPNSQDAAAIELLRECGALRDLDDGQFASAIHRARKIWASLPGAGYGQREQRLSTLTKVFQKSGGTIA